MSEPPGFAARLSALRARIVAACRAAGRPSDSVGLLAVSKTFPVGAILEARAAGLDRFGENYVQEWQSKADDPRLSGVRWHFIGHLQRNKVRLVIGRVDRIDSVDSVALAQEIARRSAARGAAQPVLLQANLAGEATKGGFSAPELIAALPELLRLPGLRIDGLMHVPPPREHAEAAVADHGALRDLRDRLAAAHSVPLPVLSMGMSHDLEAAIAAGATEVRVGTALFGARGG